jgi:prephenate dehydrogenase
MKSKESVAIFGVGLIGGSIARSLKNSGFHIVGIFRSRNKASTAKKLNVVDDSLIFGDKIPNYVNLVILACPVITNINLLAKLPSWINHKCIVMDVSSTKEQICMVAEKVLPSNLMFIGTHPIARSERGGICHSRHLLFKNRPWIICKTSKTDDQTFEFTFKLIHLLCGKPIVLSPSEHDWMVAQVSHLPMVLSSILVSSVERNGNWLLTKKVAGSGLQDTTRLASLNARIKTDIVMTNQKNIIENLNDLQREISSFIRLIDIRSDTKLITFFSNTKKIRDDWLIKNNS